MLSFLVRRLLIAGFTLLLVTFLVYGLVRSMPGDPLLAQMERSDPARRSRQEDVDRMRREFGLDRPFVVAYWSWLKDVSRFDLGTSMSRHVPTARMIREKIGPTLLLSVTSLLLAYGLAIPLGLFATVRSGRPDERGLGLLLYMLYSLPVFVAALFLQILFHQQLGWLPLDGMVSGNEHAQMSTLGKAWDILRHALLPVVCQTYGALAYYTRFIRSNMQEVVRQDYIRTARAKGVPPHRVIVHHAFRNTLIPLVTMLGLSLPGLFSGAVIIEQVFTWPGVGTLFFDSIRARDYTTIMGLVLMFSVLTLLGNLLADLLYAVVDPRVSLA